MQTTCRNLGIDILRILMAFFVVCQHISNYSLVDFILPQSRIAVPVFFIISGYFLYDKDQAEVRRKIAKSFKHILKIFLWSTLLYMMYGIYDNYPDGNFDFLKVGPWKLFVFIVSCSPLNFPYGFHLWFLIGLLEGFAILLCLSKLSILNGGGSSALDCRNSRCRYSPCVSGHIYTMFRIVLLSLPFIVAGIFVKTYTFSARYIPAQVYPLPPYGRMYGTYCDRGMVLC